MKTLNVDYINLANYNIAYYFGNLVNRGVMSIGMVLNPTFLNTINSTQKSMNY